MMIPLNLQVMSRDIVPLFPNTRLRRVDYFDSLTPWLVENDIDHLNLLKKMKEEPGLYYPRNGEVHFNGEGHSFTAKSLKDAFDDLGWL
jgi:hypothetical protein